MTKDGGFRTADFCDRLGRQVEVVDPIFSHYGGITRFWGAVDCVQVFEDNGLVRQRLQEPGDGGVLVVDGGGSRRAALVGDQLAQLAIQNGWAGLVVHGCVRDADVLAQLPIGILALAVYPRRGGRTGSGRAGVPVTIGEVEVRPGQFLYADRDGVIVARKRIEQSELT
jgi:regulator of ribonuclease activity A